MSIRHRGRRTIPCPPLPIPSPPPNSPTYVEGSLGSRAAGIRQRDALPSPVHETEMPEICLRFVKGRVVLTPWSSDARSGRVRTADAAPSMPDDYRSIGYGNTDTWDDLVGAIQEIAPTTLEGVNQRVIELATTVDQEDEIIYYLLEMHEYDRAHAAIELHSEGISTSTIVMELSSPRSLRSRHQLEEPQDTDDRATELQGPAKESCNQWLLLADCIDLLFCLATLLDLFVHKSGYLLWEPKVQGTDVVAYNQRFQELALLCDRMFPEETDKIERYVGGMPDLIYSSVVASKPKTMQEAIEMATELMDSD
ncbi:hypothetical protein Tco_1017375 [Tanacetum coccineum]|uniref:Uncharacterized protein n=1 Tax=Tanacetum coccineum TaxID=301880 RepID=A0ABQ5FSJ4_9ASTR